MNEYDDIIHGLIRYISGLRRGKQNPQIDDYISREVVAASLEHILGAKVE